MTTILDLRAEPLPLDITVRGHQIAPTYRPDWMTPAHLRAITENAERAQEGLSEADVLLGNLRTTAQMLSDVIATWELCESDGKTPVPLTPERLEAFGAALLNAISNAITDAIQARKQARQAIAEAASKPDKPKIRRRKVAD
jgi:hypothetical protein